MFHRIALCIGAFLVLSTPAAAERVRVITEDASFRQCRLQICTTLQVSRTTFSNGEEETELFFSHSDPDGNLIPVPGFPSGFTQIPSQHFVMNRRGTRATLIFSGATIAWGATDEFHSESSSTEIVRERTEEGFVRSKLTELGEQVSAEAEGTIGPLEINTATLPPSEGFASAFLIQRKTVSRKRIQPIDQ